MSPEQLSLCVGSTLDRAKSYVDALNSAMDAYEINTPARQGMFLANVGHETGGLKWLIELWGPTPAQRGYEGRADLGNTYFGDGYCYRGRGMLQTTGRANYAKLTQRLRNRWPQAEIPDFEVSPELLASAKWAAHAAADYWGMRSLNIKADAGDFTAVVKAINGGTNGMQDRLKLWKAAQGALA